MAKAPERILIIKTQAIGDLLMTTPALRDLRKAYPEAHIALMVGSWSAPAIRQNPHLNEIIEFDDRILLDRKWIRTIGLLLKIRRGRFDVALVFHPSLLLHAFAWFAGIPVRFGLLRRGKSPFLTGGVPEDLGLSTYYPVNFQSVAALAGARVGDPALEVHQSEEDSLQADALLARHGIQAADEFIVVAPGGGRNSKEDVAARRWPVEHFVELLRTLGANRPGLKVVLTGGSGDAAETAHIAANVPGAIDLTASTSLTVLYAIVRRARAVVCNDSSLLHIGVACGKPAITPFGPTGLLQRLPTWAAPFAVQSNLPCSPCYAGGRFPGCNIGFRCMTERLPDALLKRLEAALDRPG